MNTAEPTEKPRLLGSVEELIEFVLPTAAFDRCPAWPPDVFAIVAMILRRNGAYVRCVPTGVGAHATDRALFNDSWQEEARTIGRRWRDAISASLVTHSGPDKLSTADALKRTQIPAEVQAAWVKMYSEAQTTALEESADNNGLSRALLELNGYADEASYGIGLGVLGGADESRSRAARRIYRGRAERSRKHGSTAFLRRFSA
jgi:hypothetical protein